MVKRLKGSKFGEGVGGATSVTGDPNKPSFDAASHKTSTDEKIRLLLDEHTSHLMNDWERNFVMEMYGKAPMTQKQHMKVARIYKKYR